MRMLEEIRREGKKAAEWRGIALALRWQGHKVEAEKFIRISKIVC